MKLVFTLVLAAVVSARSASAFVLFEDNSTATISAIGDQTSWTVDGTTHLSSQKFFIKINANAVVALDTLSLAAPIVTASTAQFNYTDLATGIMVSVKYILDGQLPGSGSSELTLQVGVNNIGTTNTGILFQYANFDLNASPGGDQTQLFSNNPGIAGTILQKEGATVVTENTTINNGFDAWSIDTPAAVLGQVATGVLPGAPVTVPANSIPYTASGDWAWAAGWNFGGTNDNPLSFSKDEGIRSGGIGLDAPEAGSFAIWGLLGIAFGGVALRRSRG